MEPAVCIDVAGPEDVALLLAHRRHVSEAVLRRKVADGQVLVARAGGRIVGWLRFGYLWDAIPFMNLLHVLEPHRGAGVGSALVTAWEQRMKHAGHPAVLTSTQADESAQHFYRKLGYMDIGGFVLPGEPLELVLHKRLC